MTSTDWLYVARDGLLLSVLAGAWVALTLRVNPRLFLRHYPPEIRAAAAPRTRRERMIGLAIGIPLIALLFGLPIWSASQLAARHGEAVHAAGLFVTAFSVSMSFNLVDWLVIDVLWLGLFRPGSAMIPGTEHVEFVFNYRQHFRGFLVGTGLAVLVGVGAVVILA